MTALADTDGLGDIAAALAAYLAELDVDRDVCRRHGQDAAARSAADGISVLRAFEAADAVVTALRAAVLALPGWKHSASWPTGKELGDHLMSDRKSAATRRVVLRGVAWEGWPVLVHAFMNAAGDRLAIALDSPAVPLDLGELPLRIVARALRCHEHLVPTALAVPLPFDPSGADGALPVAEFLQRTTPQSLAAGQWILGDGAG
jgi:hypothetical protein